MSDSYIGRGGGGEELINHQILNHIPNKTTKLFEWGKKFKRLEDWFPIS